MRSFAHPFVATGLAAVLFALPAAGQTPASESSTVRGRVVRADADAKQLVIRTTAGKELALTVTPDSRLGAADQPVTLAQLKEGQRVRVTYEARGGTNRVLTLVPIAPAESDLGRDVRETLRKARDYSYEQKQKYDDEVRGVLDRVDDRIEDLRDRARQAGEDARPRLEKELADLKQKRDALAKRLDQARPAAKDAWDNFKAGVSGAAEDLGRALDRFRDDPKK